LEFEASENTEIEESAVYVTLKKIEFLVKTYCCLMRAIGMDTFRNHPIFNDNFISKQITAVVTIGNEVLTRKVSFL
jgi:hypothetical protein